MSLPRTSDSPEVVTGEIVQPGAEIEVRDPKPGDGIDMVVNDHGEVIVLRDATVDQLAEALDQLRAHERTTREIKAAISREFHVRFDAQARWTLEYEGWKVAGKSPGQVTYDAEKLWHELQELVKSDLLAPVAAEAAVGRAYAYKARADGVGRLKKLGGAVAEAVERCAVPIDPDARYVTIKGRPA